MGISIKNQVKQNRSFFPFLDGYKTYTAAGLMILYAFLGLYLKQVSPEQFWQMLFTAGGLAGLRNALP